MGISMCTRVVRERASCPRGAGGRVPAVLFLAVLAAACGSEGSTGPVAELGDVDLEIVAGSGVTDTTLHTPLQPLVVEVRDEHGRAPVGAEVVFSCLGAGDPERNPSMYVSKLDVEDFRRGVAFSVDSLGIVAARVQLGKIAGQGRIVVRVPDFGLADTAVYTILPASVFEINAEPEDTAVLLDSVFPVRVVVLDRHGNRRTEVVGFEARGIAADVDDSGLVSALTVGQADIVARLLEYPELEDVARVNVLPIGTIAAFRSRSGSGDTAAIAVRSLDKSEHRYLHMSIGGAFWEDIPDWAPSGDRLVFEMQLTATLFVLDMEDRLEQLIDSSYRVGIQAWPQYSQDGAWIYFSGTGGSSEIWRVRADGSEPERVGPATTSPYTGDVQPSPSPDGTEVVYTRGTSLHVLDLATGNVQSLGLAGECPRWSPVGDLIAYVNEGVVFVARPDGTGQRPVSPLLRGYFGCVDWSPDGRYIVARTLPSLDVIDTATGEAAALPGSSRLLHPSWRP